MQKKICESIRKTEVSNNREDFRMSFLKKCAAFLLAGVMALSCAACAADTTWIMKKGELEMPAGVYLNNLMQSYFEATMEVEDPSKDVLKQTIDGKDASEWIKEQALNATKESMALCDKFNQLGLSFSEQELATCQTQAKSYYEQSGDNLEKNGISQNSIELLYQITYMKTKVFDAIYGEGGEQEVSEQEMRDYYNENYIKMAVQTFSFPAEPQLTEDMSEEEKAAQQEMYDMQRGNTYSSAENLFLQGQIGRDAGKDWNEVLNQYKKDNSGEEEYDMTTNNYRLLDTATTPLDKEVVTALKEAEQGEMVKVETDTMIAVGATTDINADPTDFEYVQSAIRHALKDEEFSQMLLEMAADESFEINQDAVDRYQPKKLVVE